MWHTVGYDNHSGSKSAHQRIHEKKIYCNFVTTPIPFEINTCILFTVGDDRRELWRCDYNLQMNTVRRPHGQQEFFLPFIFTIRLLLSSRQMNSVAAKSLNASNEQTKTVLTRMGIWTSKKKIKRKKEITSKCCLASLCCPSFCIVWCRPKNALACGCYGVVAAKQIRCGETTVPVPKRYELWKTKKMA